MKGLYLVAGCAMALAGCSDADVPTSNLTELMPPSEVNLIIPTDVQKLLYTDATGSTVLPMVKGNSVSLGYTIAPDEAASWPMTWTSSDPAVATVEDGTISAISSDNDGYSIITAIPYGIQSGQGPSQTLKVNVDDILHPATAININLSADEVYVSETVKATVDIEPEATTYRTVDWSVSDPSLATIDLDGTVHANAVKEQDQSCSIDVIAKSLDGTDITASKSLLIKPIIDPTSVTLGTTYSKDNYTCAKNEQTLALDFTTVPSNATQSKLTWTTSDETVATVDGGVVTYTGYGDVTITATCPNGQNSSVTLSIGKGLLRETFHNKNHYSVYNSNSQPSTHVWHDGYITITTAAASATKQRADIKWYDTPAVLHAGNYPILAVKVDDVKDLYSAEGVTARNLNVDCVGKSESGTDYKALGNGNNKYTGDLKCSDGSHVFIYDMSTLTFGTGGLAPTNESMSFTTFQIKYADIATISKSVDYNLYWLQTFKSVDDVKAYITDVDKLTYEVIK